MQTAVTASTTAATVSRRFVSRGFMFFGALKLDTECRTSVGVARILADFARCRTTSFLLLHLPGGFL